MAHSGGDRSWVKHHVESDGGFGNHRKRGVSTNGLDVCDRGHQKWQPQNQSWAKSPNSSKTVSKSYSCEPSCLGRSNDNSNCFGRSNSNNSNIYQRSNSNDSNCFVRPRTDSSNSYSRSNSNDSNGPVVPL